MSDTTFQVLWYPFLAIYYRMKPRSTRSETRHDQYEFALESSTDLSPLIEAIGDARFVLLGEASHGTHEYYTWRTAITKRLIMEKNFSFLAVEGDWPECYRINRFIKGYSDKKKSTEEVLHEFKRWPTWMWANWEIVALLNWLKDHNERQPQKKIGFYGLDVYSLWESIEALHEYVDKYDPPARNIVQRVLACFQNFREDGRKYARALSFSSEDCRDEALKLLMEIRKRAPYYDHDPEAALNSEMNAQVIANAEAYYRSMVSFSDSSWNIRDAHMTETLEGLMKFHGEDARVVVWEHNTHVGDARFTDMKDDGMWNVGQLLRERNKDQDVFIVGFAGFEGNVIAAGNWGSQMQKLDVPPARAGSVEYRLHQESNADRLLLLRPEAMQDRFGEWAPHRAIGVVYRPDREKGNYVPTLLSRRYDALLYLDQTTALHPLHFQPDGHMVPATYPFAF